MRDALIPVQREDVMKIIVLSGTLAAVLIAGIEHYRGAPIQYTSATYSTAR